MFKRDEMKGVVSARQAVTVYSIVVHFYIQFETDTLASVDFGLRPKVINEKESGWTDDQQAVGGLLLWISG